MFKVKVDDVRTMNVAGKVKRRGRTVGLRPGLEEGRGRAEGGRQDRVLRRRLTGALPAPFF